MLTPTDIHYLVGLLTVSSSPDDVEVELGSMVHDSTAEEERDIDVTVTKREQDKRISAYSGIEVKAHKRPLDSTHVEQLWAKMNDMPSLSNRAVVSSSGYSSPAIRNGLRIVCEENGRRIIFHNPGRHTVIRYLIDNCKKLRETLQDGSCKLCDYLVIDWRDVEHYVEIKGKDVTHALRQLESTIPQFRIAAANNRIYCYIITTESPSTQSKFQVLKEKFEKDFHARLTIKTNLHEHQLD